MYWKFLLLADWEDEKRYKTSLKSFYVRSRRHNVGCKTNVRVWSVNFVSITLKLNSVLIEKTETIKGNELANIFAKIVP